MRKYAVAVGVLALGAAAAAGQGLPQTTRTVTPQILSPFGTPGTAVGSPGLSAVGTRQPAAAPAAGTPIGYRARDGSTVNTVRPPGQLVDLSKLAAPITAPLPPDLTGQVSNESLLTQFYRRWSAALGLEKPTNANGSMATGWTPGISRRNRERHKFTWWRD